MHDDEDSISSLRNSRERDEPFQSGMVKRLGQSTRIRKISFSSFPRILVNTRVKMGLSSQTSAQAEKTLHSSMCLDSSPEKVLPGYILRSF